jgi:hypothetical protein
MGEKKNVEHAKVYHGMMEHTNRMNQQSRNMDKESVQKTGKGVGRASATVAALWCLVWVVFFFGAAVCHASRKPLWHDEIVMLDLSVRGTGFAALVAGGVHEASAAPLQYVIIKVADTVGRMVDLIGIPPLVYYRLGSLVVTVIAWVWAVWFFVRKRNLQFDATTSVAIVLLAPAYFLMPMVHDWAIDMKPYALWNSIFLMLCVAFYVGARRWQFAIACLLAFSSTGSLVQLPAVAVIMFAQCMADGEKTRTAFVSTAKVYAVPLCVAALYAGGTLQFNNLPSWDQFFDFWFSRLPRLYPFFALFIFCAWTDDRVKRAMSHVLLPMLYVLAPLVFLLTYVKKTYFHAKYYIYLDLLPFFALLFFIDVWPQIKECSRYKRIATIFAVVVLMGCSVSRVQAMIFSEDVAAWKQLFSGGLITIETKDPCLPHRICHPEEPNRSGELYREAIPFNRLQSIKWLQRQDCLYMGIQECSYRNGPFDWVDPSEKRT